MKFKNIQTGSIIEPQTEFAKEQMLKSDTFVEIKEEKKTTKKEKKK